MAESTETETTPPIDSRKIIQESVEFARRNGVATRQMDQLDRIDRRVTLRMLFTHQIHYCPNSTLSEDHTKPAKMLDISLGGIGLWCREALTEGTVIHVRLPLLDGKTAWVKGRVIYCHPEVEHYLAGIAFTVQERPLGNSKTVARQTRGTPVRQRRRQQIDLVPITGQEIVNHERILS